ncbi:hypothetical protein BH11ARM2_BH11ARM2_00010 [soil metagenome]
MKIRTSLAALSVVAMLALPLTALAQSRTKNTDRNRSQNDQARNRDQDRNRNQNPTRDQDRNRDQNGNRNRDGNGRDYNPRPSNGNHNSGDHRWPNDNKYPDGRHPRPDQWGRPDDRRWDNHYRWDDHYRRPIIIDRYRTDYSWNRGRYDDRRWDTGGSYYSGRSSSNDWRNIAIASGFLGVIGLLEKDNYLAFTGLTGALYSLDRYDNDRRSGNRLDRARAAYFARPYFYRNNVRYERVIIVRGGHRYYQFCRR